MLAEKAILDLRGPVLRVTGYDVPYPYWQLEDVLHALGRAGRRRGAPAARLLVTDHELPLERRDPARALLARARARARRSIPGTRSASRCLNAGWRARAGRARSLRDDDELDAGHALVGPIEVRGARAGQTLAVRVDERRRRGAWGCRPLNGAGSHRTRLGARATGSARCASADATVDAGAVPRRARDAACRAGNPLDDPAAALRRQHRLQGARGRDARSTCRSRSTARCSRPATATPRRATARCRARRSSARRGGRAHARPSRRPRARVADRAHRRGVAHVRLRRAPGRGGRRSRSTRCST